MGNGIWSSPKDVTRGRRQWPVAFDISTAKGYWARQGIQRSADAWAASSTEKEIWDNYEYFIKQVVPVAEQAGVFIGIHPGRSAQLPMLGWRAAPAFFGNFEGL